MTEVEGTAYADAYRALRGRVTALLKGVDPARCDAIAPATPEWRVRDVLAHMVGVNADILAGNLAGVGTDPWTQVQVDVRADVSVAEMLDEWNEISPAVEEIAPMFGTATGQWLFDACTHEHDLCNALGVVGDRDTDAVVLAYGWATDRVDDVLRTRDAAGVAFVTESGTKVVGVGEPVATVHATHFEVMRALTGRRSRAQVEAYGWDGPPRPDVFASLGLFTLRTDDFVE
ncbi:MAG: maleylpyruvate isomerase family mycothiol-dependent enzyme [Actinobacteria bacterium]|nr:maleylpyruvate isomerase family mycothiol-dependent enzyme [Actinomycetota bacterium]